jgi:hypothetical protein
MQSSSMFKLSQQGRRALTAPARYKSRTSVAAQCATKEPEDLSRFMMYLTDEEKCDTLVKLAAAGFVGEKQREIRYLSLHELETFGIQPRAVRFGLLQGFIDARECTRQYQALHAVSLCATHAGINPAFCPYACASQLCYVWHACA